MQNSPPIPGLGPALAPGLWAKPGQRGQRALTILAIALMVLFPVGIAVLTVVVLSTDPASDPGAQAAGWLMTGTLAFFVASMGAFVYAYAWRLAQLDGRVPVFALERRGQWLAVLPARFWGLTRGTSRSTEATVRLGADEPLTIQRGDAVTLSLKRRWYASGESKKFYRLAVETPRGWYRSTILLGSNSLDLDALSAALAAEGAKVTFPRLDR